MKKRVFPRIVWALFLSLTAFVLLSAMQFARYGTFSRQVGGMTITGRYFNGEAAEAGESRPGWVRLDGEANVFFGGIEFRLASLPGAAGGFSLVDAENVRHQVLPEYVFMAGNEAIFSLPFGAELSFTTSQALDGELDVPGMAIAGFSPELRITGTFPEGFSAIDIPFRPRRASVAWDNARGIMGVTHEGIRHMFSRHSQDLMDGRLVLLAGRPPVFYRVMPDVIANDPVDFVIPGMETGQAFSQVLAAWSDRKFDLWGSNMPANVDEDRVIAFNAEALRQGVSNTAAAIVPAAFGQGLNRTWESAVFQIDSRVGVWEHGVEVLVALEREKVARVSEFLARRDYGSLFAEYRLIEFLAVRGHNSLIDSIVSSAVGIDPATLALSTSAGVLESHADMGRRRAGASNPFEPLAARARELVSDGLRQNGDQVLVFSADGLADVEFNLRLGKVLREWGEQTGNADWAGLGRSLILSVISLGDSFPGDFDGSVPALLTSGANGVLTASPERIGSASLFRMLDENEFLPRARTTGVDGVWAWTAARSINLVQTTNFMDVAVDFPAGQSHYVMLRNVRPFVQLHMHGANTVRNPSFENNQGVSGWYYFEEEQTLVLKIHHRANVENVRVVFTIPQAPPPVVVAAPPPPAPAPTPPPAAVPPPATTTAPADEPPRATRPPTWTPPPAVVPVPPVFFPQLEQ